MAFSCPTCAHTPVDYVGTTDDARTRLHCPGCGHDWLHSPAEPVPGRVPARRRALTRDEAWARFPTEDDLTDATRTRVAALKRRFLTRQPAPDPAVEPYFREYRRIFSEQGLPAVEPARLKAFANSTVGAHPGNMAVFNRAWNAMGDRAAAEQVRRVVAYLLRGTDAPVEDRMDTLIHAPEPVGMTGFRESLLTRVLCVTEPERFLPILIYTSPRGGKREIASSIFGLDLPAPESTSMTTGRLAFWSNDLLRRLCGDGFVDVAHASEFLWWSKDQSA